MLKTKKKFKVNNFGWIVRRTLGAPTHQNTILRFNILVSYKSGIFFQPIDSEPFEVLIEVRCAYL